MRNLLGRLHARRLPELLRIAEAWHVPVHGDSKGDIVGVLYRAMTDSRTMRDMWDRLDVEERALATALADAADASVAPTVSELARRLGVAESDARETALRLYRSGVLAREGDDEPLPVGAAPRLILPREIALNIRRVHDEMAAGDLAQSPLRVLIELLDDAEIEAAAALWGMRTVPGVARRGEVATRLLRLVNDRDRVERAARGRSRDAAAIWKVVRAASGPLPLSEVAAQAGLGANVPATVARLRAALAELEGALLVWHAYHGDGTRWLFVPAEVRHPGQPPAIELPPLTPVELAPHETPPWRHPDAMAWDLLSLLRVVTDAAAPAWVASDPPPRWLERAAALRFWHGGAHGPPVGYLELLQSLGLAVGVLAVDEEARPPRMVAGPHAKPWRRQDFAEQSAQLRDRWLRLARWTEGEPAGVVEIWGADWRGMRPRLLAALADPRIGLATGIWVTTESLAGRIAAQYPALLGPSFVAATARMGGEVGAGHDEDEARRAALSDLIALELGGAFAWFGILETCDQAGRTPVVRLTAAGASLAARKPLPARDDAGSDAAPLLVAESGEITLQVPSPERVWALSAFAEPVDLGRESHYRISERSIASALAAGSTLSRITEFLERGSRRSLPTSLAANIAAWSSSQQPLCLQRAVVLRCDDAAQREMLARTLHEAGWQAELLGERAVLVLLSATDGDGQLGEEALLATLGDLGLRPQWTSAKER